MLLFYCTWSWIIWQIKYEKCYWHMSFLATIRELWASQNQQNDLCAQRRLRSAWASTQSYQSLLCTQWVAKDLRFLQADREDSDQTGRMPRLIWVFAGRTGQNGFVRLWHSRTYKMMCTQRGLNNLFIRTVRFVFAVCIKKYGFLGFPYPAKSWDCMDVQADLCICWAQYISICLNAQAVLSGTSPW